MAILLILLPLGCNDKVNFGKADRMVGSYISAQVKGDKQTVDSVINQDLKDIFMKEKLYFQDKYDLEKASLATTNIFELQSNEKQKIIAANYVIEDGQKRLNITSLFLLEKKGDNWSIKSIEEIALQKSLES